MRCSTSPYCGSLRLTVPSNYGSVTFGSITSPAGTNWTGSAAGNVISLHGGTQYSSATTIQFTFTATATSAGSGISWATGSGVYSTTSYGGTTLTGDAYPSTTVTQAGQTITVTTHAPGSAAYNSLFSVVATASSGLAVAITTTGSCSGGGSGSAAVTMTSGTGTCTVHYNQAGNTNYSSAPEVTEATSANKLTVTASVTAAGKTYDRTATATITNCSLSGVLAGDASNVTCAAAGASFGDANVGTGKTVTATGITLGGTARGQLRAVVHDGDNHGQHHGGDGDGERHHGQQQGVRRDPNRHPELHRRGALRACCLPTRPP